MGKHRQKLHELKRILGKFGVQCEMARGKGGHILFWKEFEDGRFSYPVPNKADVLPCYVKGSRKKFRLMPKDGISDEAFYGK
jgi:hypothetical protein